MWSWLFELSFEVFKSLGNVGKNRDLVHLLTQWKIQKRWKARPHSDNVKDTSWNEETHEGIWKMYDYKPNAPWSHNHTESAELEIL